MPTPASPAPPRAEPVAPDAGREPHVTLATVVGAHGIGGEVRLRLFTDDLSAYPVLHTGGRTLALISVRPGPNGAVARFDGVGDRSAAELLRGAELTVPRAQLPPLGEGEYYHHDLVGLAVVSIEGEPLGEVTSVENFGAGDLLEVRRPDGHSFMVPMTAQAVPEWQGRVVIDTAFLD